MNTRRFGAWAVVAACALIAVTGQPASATDGGTVYFSLSGAETLTISTMAPDGSGKFALYTGENWGARALSRGQHAGKRWLLETRRILGETYAGTSLVRRELFAVPLDGSSATQLTSQADLMPYSTPCWSPADASISWLATRWSGGVQGPTQVYTAPVVFDGSGAVVGIALQPATPVSTFAIGVSHDWSPDATRMVVHDPANAIWIMTLSTGALVRLQATVIVKRKPTLQPVFGTNLAWSPDGSRIAYASDRSIRTIAPDGSNAATIVPKESNTSISYYGPAWSPASSDLVFVRSYAGRSDVYRVSAGGGATTNLTADLDTRNTPSGGVGLASPMGWR